MTETEILRANIAQHGTDEELTVAAEECAELIHVISKIKRYGLREHVNHLNHLAEEIADVEIMIAQIKMIYNCTRLVDIWKEIKLERIEKQLPNQQVNFDFTDGVYDLSE